MAVNATLLDRVEDHLADHMGERVSVIDQVSVAGGSINVARRLELSNGDCVFLKSNAGCPADFFRREAEGLSALRAADAICVPDVLAVGEDPKSPFLLLECIMPGTSSKRFAELFGRQFAHLHKCTSRAFGFDTDNYIGATPQPNTESESWVDFFREKRLAFQFGLAKKLGRTTTEMLAAADHLMGRLDDLIGSHAPCASLLHGDLWSGNFMVSAEGEPVLLDPAVYYGDREADLAMTELFGRFSGKFYAAYREAWPLADGYEERRDIYNLYHLINHLNLFGGGYYESVMSTLRKYA